MNELERFKAVVQFEQPDYIPIFGFSGAPGMAGGCMEKTHRRLIETGMPETVGGCWGLSGTCRDLESWYQYWGTTGPDSIDFFPAEPAPGITSHSRIEGDWEIIEYETGARTRQVIDNAITYMMPDFQAYHVRDRASWIHYRDRATPGALWSRESIELACHRFDDRQRPLALPSCSTWGGLRSLMGPETACTVLYDDPGLAHEIMEWFAWRNRTYLFPLIERLRPEIVYTGEDMCYNHGMFISPKQFNEFCAPLYIELCQFARSHGVLMIDIDTDGNAMELVSLVEACGVNSINPFEVKAGNDLFVLRERYPKFILMGWLEKEVINQGNGHLIEQEIMSKVPTLLQKGGYFPNGDHGIQPLVTFENLCRFMTLLHEVTRNPEGTFPRIR